MFLRPAAPADQKTIAQIIHAANINPMSLETYYTRFGFREIAADEMTPYFRRIVRMVNLLRSVSRRDVRIIVMKREGDPP